VSAFGWAPNLAGAGRYLGGFKGAPY